MSAVNSHTSTRLPLSLAPRNRNLPAPGRLTRQVGKSNLLVLNSKTQNIENNTDSIIVEPLKENVCLGTRPMAIATRSRPIAPIVKGSFEVFCDDDVENNVIHQLEKRCNDEDRKKLVEKTIRKSPLKKQQSRPARKPLSSIASQHYDFDLDDDVFSVISQAPSGATTIRSEFSSFGVDDVEDTQSSHYGSALDYELDSKDEYMTAQSEKEAHEDLIYCNPEFSKDVYRYMRDRETKVRPKANYMEKQTDITSEMRAILIDWLSDVTQEYNLHQETFHLSISLVDRTLSRFRAERARLQLIGATAMMIAAKYEEIYPPELKEFVYITDDTYSAPQILQMERVILGELNFDVAAPTSQWFASRFAKQQRAGRRTINALNMLLDLVLLDVTYLSYRPSYIAAACLCYANVLTGPTPWSAEMEAESGICIGNITGVLRCIHETFRLSSVAKHRSIHSRYSNTDYDEVAHLPAPSVLPL